jgi:tRNA-(ms[2]io[6]A)-hydroxylase
VLISTTDPRWVNVALADLDALLVDHAHCEKKAAASAMSLIAGYPSRVELVRKLSALAVEELKHFRAVHEHLIARGLSLGRDAGDPYAQKLLALARPSHGRLMDRLLLFGLIEARSHERFVLLSAHVENPSLRRFYSQLAEAESRHAEIFRELACRYDKSCEVERRLVALSKAEAKIVAALPLEPRIH